MNYGNIKKYDIANGEGVRVTLFVSGCTNHCFNCFQPETWDFDYGQPFTNETMRELLEALRPDYIQGLTLLGGDPFELSNQEGLIELLREVKKQYPEKDIWSYTGFILDQDLLDGGRRHGPYTDEMLSYIDVLVDGPFIQDKKNISLKFRGSENQRVIDLKKSLKKQEVILYLD
ncbi:anaerobic ribonucleoside-triphosphate reductase activating protein [uncultured Dubosiella sp.]|uniref:anaerobic ribonucleoside-triphosphate reductase activating protein n=1 Tax=uncultured Dubosiella sp. TaxID=1937011 RepID=UPI00208B640F|nr:anaerobic ribonucleoside-triphosphate reductase activating protein [uncultured Dubosiella sp.]GJM58967.1 anaerobic ribonucleoside-triphosphate reductase-activating protein [Erysipelotrichaceae bacterium OPF54]GJM59083.1 anaerobic ribonucleoside-triphosphate reductase-activating protein [Erysipelotrichaceae bacterium OPF54]